MRSIDLIGVGSPLVDLLIEVDDAFLSEHVSGDKGGMEMVDMDAINALLENTVAKLNVSQVVWHRTPRLVPQLLV